MGKSELSMQRDRRSEWFRQDRFGMFIHWGLYAIPARGEWVRSAEKMPEEDYMEYFKEFDPVRYDPKEWAKTAKRAGMRYAVLTAKHHDGFCLFETGTTDFNATRTLAGRDLVKEYVEAFRAEGLKVGLYYSLPDWHHPDYPAYGDRQHPMRDNPAFKDKTHHFDRYVSYMHEQVRELCTNYGKIDLLWFDFSYWQYKGEAWRATDMIRMVRELQPDILIDNRLGGNMFAHEPDSYAGDFHGPEQGVPREGLVDEDGCSVPWEACITLNNSWGYASADNVFKDAKFVIRTLVNCVSKGGNLLVNVGPNAYGEIPAESVERLQEVGKWLETNGKSIYGCDASNFAKPEWGRYTQKGKILFAHVTEQVVGHISLQGLKGKIRKARLLRDGSEAILTEFWNAEVDTFDGPNDIFMNFALPVQSTFLLPDPVDTVVQLELAIDETNGVQ